MGGGEGSGGVGQSLLQARVRPQLSRGQELRAGHEVGLGPYIQKVRCDCPNGIRQHKQQESYGVCLELFQGAKTGEPSEPV